MDAIPRDRQLDATRSLLTEGYRFVSNRCDRLHSDAFETRLMLRKAICIRGEDAARMFYQPDRFTRRRALPPTALLLLQDVGSVQLQDGQEHRHRKHLFTSLMTPERVARLSEIAAVQWRRAFARWEKRSRVVIHAEAEEVLCRAVCAWSGIVLSDDEVHERTREFSAMIEGAGAVGWRTWRGMMRRARTEHWAQRLIARARTAIDGQPGIAEPLTGSVLDSIARYRDADGKMLSVSTAAIELINILRPTVAVARFITFAVHALHHHPESRSRIASGDTEYLDWFVLEVRRFYPFFPAVGGRVQNEFEWRGHRFTKGTWVLLDLYGTNHDARIWNDPEQFRPERFCNWDHGAFNFVPQGGGELPATHRCPGEGITNEQVKTAVRLLTTEVRYEVPDQDLRIDLSRMPAIPESRVVISNVSPVF